MQAPHRRGRASRTEQVDLLSNVIARVRAHRHTLATALPAVVFDLDGTLLDSRPRSCAILHELAEEWRERHPELAARMRQARPELMQYLFRENLRALGINSGELFTEAVAFWQERFFCDDFLHHDVATPGALEFARHCYDAGARLCYLTGRDLPNMALGSLASLRDLGFPIAVPGTELVLKPASEMSDFDFKLNVTRELHRSGHVVAAFDNEPGNCNVLKVAFPDLHLDVSVIENFRIEP
jgi:hypothetical protein